MQQVERDVELAAYTTMGVGGPARYFVQVASEPELAQALAWARRENVETFVLGGGSNLVVADRGLDALVVRVALRGLRVEGEGASPTVRVAAGEPWDGVVAAVVRSGLAGLECLSGIPGDAGATPIQNVGAYGQEVGDTIVSVVALERASGERVELAAEACGFAYRDSWFKREGRGRVVVSEVVFRLRRGPPDAPRYAELARSLAGATPGLEQMRQRVLELRRAKSMVLEPGADNAHSCGSFFTNPIVELALADRVEAAAKAAGVLADHEHMPRFGGPGQTVKLSAGWLIERAGFTRGTVRGAVGISTRHALALVNRGGARASDIIALAQEVQAGVHACLGVRLTPEPELVGFDPGELGALRQPKLPIT